MLWVPQIFSSAINIQTHVFLFCFIFFFVNYIFTSPKRRIVGLQGNFIRNCHTVFQSGICILFCIPPALYKSFRTILNRRSQWLSHLYSTRKETKWDWMISHNKNVYESVPFPPGIVSCPSKPSLNATVPL